LDEELGLQDKHWSESVVKEAVWLSGVVDSDEAAAAVLRRIGKVNMSTSSVWRRVQKWGSVLQAVESEHTSKATALQQPNEAVVPVQAPGKRLGAAMDGAMVHIRNEGWKELKAGCVFAIEPQIVIDQQTREAREQDHATQLSYVAHLGGPNELGQRLWAEAQQRGWEQAADTQVIGDGAAWIWQLSEEFFAPRQQTVDWYHATEHLHAAAQLLHPQQTPAATRWYNQAETRLFQGHAEKIACQLSKLAIRFPAQAEGLLAQATYFHNNQRRMNYLELREEGYLLGSGMIESGAKQFKARFTGPGMRWSRSGITHLIPIRAAVLSDTFDHLWPAIFSFSKN
jgi:hypothetical protein